MKSYEKTTTSLRLNPELPICARIDGRSFSSFTRGCQKPFDDEISNAMRATCAFLVDKTHARIGYVQSDEISLVWQANEGGSVFFDGKVMKMASVLASMAGVKFFSAYGGEKLPAFDCRVWQLPSQTEAANAILWRAIDARKNAVSSACRAHNSAKSMHKKGRDEQLEMLLQKGIDFEATYSAQDRHGVFYQRVTGEKFLDDDTWNKIPDGKKPDNRMVMRSWVAEMPAPYFGDVEDRVSFIFGDLSENQIAQDKGE
ncbi:MAG: tRNA(His) guanylyltransferase Thg1 family protein [Paracoccaceae bacterium]